MKCAFCSDPAVKTINMLFVCNFHFEALKKRQIEKDHKKIKGDVKQNGI